MDDFSNGRFQEEEVSLSDYIQVLYRGRWVILLSFIVVFTATVYFTFTTPPTYEATTLIMLESKPGEAESLFSPMFGAGQVFKVNNQIEVLKSRTLAYNVIRSLMHSPYADSLFILGTRKGKVSTLSKLKSGIKSLLTFWKKEDAEEAEQDTLYRSLVKNLQNSVEIEPKRDTEAIYIKVSSQDPFEAALIANTIAKEYYNQDLNYTRTELVELKGFLQEQLTKIEKDLQRSESALKRYQEEEQVFGISETAQTLIDQLSTFEATYNTALAEQNITERRLNSMKSQLNEREKALLDDVVNTTNPFILEMRNKIAELETQKITMMTNQGYTENDPGIRELTQRINDLKNKLFDVAKNMTGFALNPTEQSTISAELLKQVIFLDADLLALRTKSREYKKLVDLYSAKLSTLPEKSLEYARLDRERQVNEKYYMLMKTKLQESKIAEASRISAVRIIDYAIPPEEPVKPKKKLNLILGIFIGLGLGIGIAFIMEYMDNSVRTTEDIERLGLNVLGMVASIDTRTALDQTIKRLGKSTPEEHTMRARLITHYDPKSPVAESYRTLRTNVTFSKADKPVQTVIISSPGPGDGKSTTVSNLAITFANLGKKTLLVDGDLRRPVIHKIFSIPRSPGLSSVIVKDTPYKSIVHHSEIENLDVLTTGHVPPNPSELLGSMKMKHLLEELKKEYEIILFDSPPILAVTDSTVLGSQLDGMILVSSAGNTDKNALERSKVILEGVNISLLGVVLNNIQYRHTYGSYYYYYHYYYYYGDGEKKKKRRRSKRKRKAIKGKSVKTT